MLTGVSPMATPAAVACNQVESRHATRTMKPIFSLECFKTAWKHGKRTLEIEKDPQGDLNCSLRPPAADVIHRSGRGCLIRTMIRDSPMAMW